MWMKFDMGLIFLEQLQLSSFLIILQIRNLDFWSTFQASTSQTMKVTTRLRLHLMVRLHGALPLVFESSSFTVVVSTDTNKASFVI
jgi:hypothetical protein